MPSFALTCCSTADLAADHLSSLDVSWAPFHFHMEGEDYLDDLGGSMPFDVFYSRIAKGALPTTSQVNVEEFCRLFEPALQAGQDILHISLSSGLSGAYSAACVARDELLPRFPGREICVVDSLGASSGYGLLVDTAARLRDSGNSLAQAHDWLLGNRLRLHHWFFSGDLSHYKRGGRISAASATMGNLLQICPLMNMDSEGHLIQREKVRGKKHVIEAIVNKMQAHAQDGLGYSGKCYISHSACYDDARAVADAIEACFERLDGPVLINSVGAVIGSHTGPGTVALFFYGDERGL